MNIALKWDQSQLEFFAGQLPKRLAYASVNALRATQERIQQAEFDRARSIFTIRKQAFFFGTDKRVGGVAARLTVRPSVKKGIAYAEITGGALPKGGDELSSYRRLLYGGFETGTQRDPFTPGAKSVAVPRTGGPARPTRSDAIAKPFTFAGMQLRAFYRGKKLKRQTRSRKNLGVGVLGEYGRLAIPRGTEGVQWKGRDRTFIVFTAKRPLGQVMQRMGRGKEAMRLVWLFEQPFKLHSKLEFVKTAEAAAAGFFREECERQVQDVLRHDATKALRAAL